MAFSTGNDSGGPMAEINVTPLVDVMLVLLIIFMITAPLMQHKIKVELPQANLDKNADDRWTRDAADHAGGEGRRRRCTGTTSRSPRNVLESALVERSAADPAAAAQPARRPTTKYCVPSTK